MASLFGWLTNALAFALETARWTVGALLLGERTPAETIVCKLDGSFYGLVFSLELNDSIPEEYFPRAGYMAFTKQTKLGLEVLMLKHADTSPRPGCWDLPGGTASRGNYDAPIPDDEAKTIHQRFKEETGWSIADVQYNRAATVLLPPDRFGGETYAVALTVPVGLGVPVPAHLGPGLESAEWVPIDDAIARVSATTSGAGQNNGVAAILQQVKLSGH
jgi:8-oxo-dGTP pyrophosphatase MutT (NUDIX family)